MNRWDRWQRRAAVAGLGAIVLGTLLPRLRLARARFEGVGSQPIDPAWTAPGPTGVEFALLGAVLVVFAVYLRTDRSIVTSTSLLVTGLATGWVCYDALQRSYFMYGVQVTYEPAAGWSALLLGALAVSVLGVIGLAGIFDVDWLTALGALAVIVGTYLPWYKPNPAIDGPTYVPLIVVNGDRMGLAGFDFLFLAGIATVLVLDRVSSRRWLPGIAALAVGGGIFQFTFHYFDSYYWIGFGQVSIPASGWYLTLVGSGLLILAGGRLIAGVVDRIRRRQSTRPGSVNESSNAKSATD